MSALFQAAADETAPACHVLVVGVSAYDHLPGGTGALTEERLAAGLGQLSAAASSATRIALWFRDHFESPTAVTGSIRLLASPGPDEIPLPGGVTPDPATYANVRSAVGAWRTDLRRHADNVAVLYVAGHGIQTSAEGGIVLLQDFGSPDSLTPLERAVDVGSVRRGMRSDPNRPDTATPQLQFYFYDACRVTPKPADGYLELRAGVCLDEPRGRLPKASWVSFGARAQAYALADVATRTTLYSEALLDCLDRRAEVAEDGRTVRFAGVQTALEAAVGELAKRSGEQQDATVSGAGSLSVPVHRRPLPAQESVRGPAGGGPLREVVVGSDRGAQVSIRGEGGETVGDYGSGSRVRLALGEYTAVLPLPWGGETSTPFTVEARTQRFDVVVTEADPAATPGGSPRLERLLAGAGDTSPDAEPFHLRFLRWVDARFVPVPDAEAPATRALDAAEDADGLPGTAVVEVTGGAPVHLQVFTTYGRSRVVALPITSTGAQDGSRCRVYVRNGRRDLAVAVRLGDPVLDSMSGYLTSGRPDRALAALSRHAERVLFAKLENPVGAALAGYALLRLNELERLHDWPANLAQWFEWLPDGPVIAGALAARTGDGGAAAEYFIEAARRGLPLFSEGLSLLVAGAAALGRDDTLPAEVISRLRAAVRPIDTLAVTASFPSLTTNLEVDPQLAAQPAAQPARNR